MRRGRGGGRFRPRSHTTRDEHDSQLPLARLNDDDRAQLARLVARSRPDNAEAQAVAGIRMELSGHTDIADQSYQKAGPGMAEKLAGLFE